MYVFFPFGFFQVEQNRGNKQKKECTQSKKDTKVEADFLDFFTSQYHRLLHSDQKKFFMPKKKARHIEHSTTILYYKQSIVFL